MTAPADLAPGPLGEIFESSEGLARVAFAPDHEVQIVYTQIHRDTADQATFESFGWNVEPEKYFYPASTVKLPVAILALEKLGRIKEVDRQTQMLNVPFEAKAAPVEATTVANELREMLLVSDNAAYNRLFDWLGPEVLSDGLQKRGYHGVEIFHRLESGRKRWPLELNGVEFRNRTGELLHRQEPRSVDGPLKTSGPRFKGKAHFAGGKLVTRPMDFSELNAFPLETQQRLLRALVFPKSVPAAERFQLGKEQQGYLLRELSMLVSEDPTFEARGYSDTFTKMLFFGTEPLRESDSKIRIFSKSGMAYGYLIDNAYVIDLANRVEFFLSAVVHVCANGVYNDDVYEYETIGLPFLRDLGRAVHAFELKRDRRNRPDFRSLEK